MDFPTLRAVLLAACLAAAACDRSEPTPAPSRATTTATPKVEPPGPPPVLDRAALLEAARQAQASYAAGAQIEDAGLAGRRIRVETAFGCAGPAADLEAAASGWRYETERETLRAVVRPTDLLRLIPAPVGSEPTLERADAFWISYPWLATADCPVGRTGADHGGDAQPPGVGVLAFRVAGQARTGATDAYQITRRAPPEAAPRAGVGLRRVLEGRVTPLPDGRAFACSGSDLERPPTCLLAVDLERVAIVEPGSGDVLGEWTRGPS